MNDRLFDVPDIEPPADVSAGVRLTLRRRALLDAGIHPASRKELLANSGLRCKNCAHLTAVHHNSRVYNKCLASPLGTSRSQHSDVRVNWPACVLFTASPTQQGEPHGE